MNKRKRTMLKAVEICFRKGKMEKYRWHWWQGYYADEMAERIRRIWLYWEKWLKEVHTND